MSPRIVSGFDPQGNMTAFLAGRQESMRRQQMQQAAQQAEAERQAAMMEQMQQAALKHKNEQAKALEDANKRAQMGDVQAMEQQNMEARAQGAPPEQKRLKEMSGILSKITDPQARDDARKEFMGYEKQLRDEEQKQALNKVIEDGVKDDLMKPEEVQQRQATGEEPEQLAKELIARRSKRRDETVAGEKNSKKIEEARAAAELLPEGEDRDAAMKEIVDLELSPSKQADPRSGEAVLGFVKRLGAKQEALKRKAEQEAFKEDVGKQPWGLLGHSPGKAFGLAGTFGGPEGPKTTPGKRETSKGTEALVAQALQESDDLVSAAKWLQSKGRKLTPEFMEQVKAAYQKFRSQGAAASQEAAE